MTSDILLCVEYNTMNSQYLIYYNALNVKFCHIENVRCEANLQQQWRQLGVLQLQVRRRGTAFNELRQTDISFLRFKRLL